MKKLSYLFLSLSAMFVACSDDNFDTLTGNENTGGLVSVNKVNIGYVVGNGDTFQYTANVSAFHGREKVQTVDVYKQFTNIDGDVSNKVLLTTITFPNAQQTETFCLAFTYPQLISGLTINGASISSDDTTLNIGDYFTLTYVSTSSDGDVTENATTTKVAVGTRFAGNYKCIEGSYYRIGVLTRVGTDWPPVTVIESVNSTTYRVKKYFGPFTNSSTATGGDYYFSIDSSGNITYPLTTPTGVSQSGNGQPFISCQTHPGELNNVQCSSSNYVVRDDVAGKDKLYMSFGYLNAPGESREFYQVMEKIVD